MKGFWAFVPLALGICGGFWGWLNIDDERLLPQAGIIAFVGFYDGPKIYPLRFDQIMVPAQDNVQCVDDFEWVLRRQRITKTEWAMSLKGEELHVNPLDDDQKHIMDHRRRIEHDQQEKPEDQDPMAQNEMAKHIKALRGEVAA